MLDLFDDSTRRGDGGRSVPCSKEPLVPEPGCPVGSLMGVIGGGMDSQAIHNKHPHQWNHQFPFLPHPLLGGLAVPNSRQREWDEAKVFLALEM